MGKAVPDAWQAWSAAKGAGVASTGAAALIDELYIEWHADDVGLQQQSREAFLGNMSLFRRRESDIGPLVQQLREAGVKVVGRWP